ncbi:Triosephosphate isomerase [Viridothelium virens]|uniref:Triosephosphate isomerase n=1 Tax=Viridothelium virens TaxID=1048519 RepID=A0A6A6HDH2_VIRVR|nr:Triosephosphate isomerase [Viridothelium virens]
MPSADRPKRLVGTSLKMYFDLAATTSYVKGVQELDTHAKSNNVDLFVIPDFLAILPSHELLKDTSVILGAQDAFWEDRGAYTGEVSPLSLAQAGVKIVEMGHAERRRIFGETDEQVAKKAAAATHNHMVPLVCIGEKSHGSIASAAVGMAVEECRPQVMSILSAVPDEAEIILAYEPVWAIGAKEPADADHVVNVTKEIMKMTAGRKGLTRILYGGSAGPGTFKRLAEGVDGLFLGRFAHDLNNLKQVITELGEN